VWAVSVIIAKAAKNKGRDFLYSMSGAKETVLDRIERSKRASQSASAGGTLFADRNFSTGM
jgi:hypothetical protein